MSQRNDTYYHTSETIFGTQNFAVELGEILCQWRDVNIAMATYEHWRYMCVMAAWIASNSTTCLTSCSCKQQCKYKSSVLLTIFRGTHQWAVDSLGKGTVTRNVFPCNDVISNILSSMSCHFAIPLHGEELTSRSIPRLPGCLDSGVARSSATILCEMNMF